MTESGVIVKPHRKLDKEAYNDIVMEEKNRQLRVEMENRRRQI